MVTVNAWNTYTEASSDFVNNPRLLFPDWSNSGDLLSKHDKDSCRSEGGDMRGCFLVFVVYGSKTFLKTYQKGEYGSVVEGFWEFVVG